MVLARRVRRGAALCALALALAVGGCGRRGRLEPPPDPDHPFAYGYPAAAKAAGEAGGETRTATPRRAKNPPIKAPDEPFVLDPLL